MAGDVREEQLAAWEALAAEATPPPWWVQVDDQPGGLLGGEPPTYDARLLAGTVLTRDLSADDARFAAAARTGWPATMRALRETRAQLERPTAECDQHLRLLDWRGVDAATVCRRCGGSGRWTYSDTSTWARRGGGQSLTADVCDACWGTGDTERRGADLRRMAAEVERLRQWQGAIRRQVYAALREVAPHADPGDTSLDGGETSERVALLAAEVERLRAQLAVESRAVALLDASDDAHRDEVERLRALARELLACVDSGAAGHRVVGPCACVACEARRVLATSARSDEAPDP